MDTSAKTISTWTHKASFWLTFLLPIFLICFSVSLSSVSLNALKAAVLVVVASLVLIFSLIDKINKKDLDLRFSAGNILSFALCVVVLLASFSSNSLLFSFLGNGIEEPSGITLISVLIFSFLFSKYQKDSLEKFSIVFLILYILSSVFSIILFIFPSILNTSSSFNLFGSLSSFAIVSAISLSLATFFIESGKVGAVRLISILGMVIATIVLIFINSRFAFIFTALILAFSFFKNVIWHKDIKFPIFSFTLITIFIFFIFGKSIVGDFFPKIINLQSSEISPSFQASFEVLEGQIKEKPFLGIGPSRFFDSWMKYQPQSIVESSFWNTGFYYGQNSLFYTGVTLGVFGLIILFGLILYSVILYFKRIEVTNEINKNIQQIFFLSSVLLFFLFPVDVAFLTVGFIGLALVICRYDKVFSFETNSNNKKRISLSILSLGLFLAVLFLILGILKFAGLVLTEKSERIVVRSNDFEKAHFVLEKAIKIFPNTVALENDLFFRKQKVLEEIKKTSPDLQTHIAESVLSAKNLIRYNSNSYSSWSNVGAYFSELARFGIDSAKDEAQIAFAQAQILSPRNPTPVFLLGRLFLIVGDIDNARVQFKKALEIKSNYSEPYVYLGILEEKNGNMAIAESNYQKAVEINLNERNFVNLGNFYLRSGDLSYARDSFLRAVTLSSNINQNYLTLVMIYSTLGENDNAVELLNAMIRRYPDNQALQSTMQKINAGDSFEQFLVGKEVLIP
jgi:tetratricopeptide (TPR) repeat protein